MKNGKDFSTRLAPFAERALGCVDLLPISPAYDD